MLTLFDQVAGELSSAAATQASMSGNWLGAVGASLLGAGFAAGSSVLGSLPLTRLTVLQEATEGKKSAALLRYLQNPTRVLSRWLAGRIVCTALTAVLIGDAVRYLSHNWTVPITVLGTLGTYGLLVEIATAVAHRNTDQSAPFLLRLLRPFEWLTLPVAWPLEAVARLSGRLIPPAPPSDGRSTEQEVGLLLAESQKAGTLGQEHAQMIQNVLEFNELTAAEVMIPRTSLIAIDAKAKLESVLDVIASKGHSRYPVYRDAIDNIIGLLYAKDLFRVLNDPGLRSTAVESFVRAPVNFVPETQPVSALLREMRARRLHMAVVVDDYGGVSGIVTLEDIVEQIIGDIQDEHDSEEDPVVELGDGRVLVDASMPINDLAEFLGTDIEDEGDFVSLGGMLIHRAGRVPSPGSELQAHGYRFIVREADERRVSKVEICPLSPDAPTDEPGGNASTTVPSISP